MIYSALVGTFDHGKCRYWHNMHMNTIYMDTFSPSSVHHITISIAVYAFDRIFYLYRTNNEHVLDGNMNSRLLLPPIKASLGVPRNLSINLLYGIIYWIPSSWLKYWRKCIIQIIFILWMLTKPHWRTIWVHMCVCGGFDVTNQVWWYLYTLKIRLGTEVNFEISPCGSSYRINYFLLKPS